MAGRDDDEDEGEIKETPAHARGGTKSEVDDEPGKKEPKARIDDPDQSKKGAKGVEVDGEYVEVIEDVDASAKDDDAPKKRAAKDEDDGEDEKDGETRGKKRRRDRKHGRERDREELRLALEKIGGLEKTITKLAEGQRASEEQSEATLLANTKAALNTVMAQRAEAIATNDPRANELDEAVYRLRRQRDDLETSIERRERGAGREGTERDGGGNGAAASQWSPDEVRTVRGFIKREIPWFDPNGGDRDSRIALDISREMTAEKWRPLDDDWDEELLERLQEALPHRFENDQDSGKPPKRQSPPVGGRGREGGSGGGNGGFKLRLTDAHKQALADSGHERGSPEYNSIIATWVREAKAARQSR